MNISNDPKIGKCFNGYNVTFSVTYNDEKPKDAAFYLRDLKVKTKLEENEAKTRIFASSICQVDVEDQESFQDLVFGYLDHKASVEALKLADKLKEEIECSVCLGSFNKDVFIFIERESYRTCGTESVHALCINCMLKLYDNEDNTIAGFKFNWNTCITCQDKNKGNWKRLI